MVDLHSAVALTLLVNHVERLDLPITQEHQPGSPSVSSPTLSSLGMCSGGYLTPLVTSSASGPTDGRGKPNRPGLTFRSLIIIKAHLVADMPFHWKVWWCFCDLCTFVLATYVGDLKMSGRKTKDVVVDHVCNSS